MARALTATGLLLFICWITTPVWSSEGVPPWAMSQNWATGFSLQSWSGTTPVRANAEVLQTAFSSNVTYPTIHTARLRDLAPESDRPRIEQLLATTTWLNGKLATEAEVAHSFTGSSWLSPSIGGHTRADASTRMFRVGLIGTEGNLRYGAAFRQAGQGFLVTPDRASRELWGEWKAGWVTLRNAIGQTWNNVEGEATRSRLEQTYGRVGFLLTLPSWPELSVTYARNSLSSMLEPVGVAPQRSSNHTIEGAVAFQRPSWDVRFASSYVLANDLLRSDADSTIRTQTFSAVLRPINTVTITPLLAYRQEYQSWSGIRIDNPMASVALSYQRNSRLLLSTVGNYANSRSTDGMIHNETLRWKGILDWVVHTSADCTTKVGFEAGYNRLNNQVSRSMDTEDISGLIRLGIVSR